ncbi:MAG: tetratricopeptide repeat protein [Pseudomonadota bacterium]|nr:tetratricopeptide repeat protein [Pseudomonadota bacterium]
MNTQAIARNAPCPCGSGKRYKDCHGTVDARVREPITADSLLREAQVAIAAGRAAVAHALVARAVDLAPDRADLLRERARIEWILGEASAAATCHTAIDRAPSDVSAWNLLGEMLNAADPAAAAMAWRHALELEPQNPEALFHLGNRHRELGENDAAIDYYERALAKSPGHHAVLNNLGLALEASGNYERAEDCYREVLAAQSQHADALANLANLLQGRKRYQEAALAYEKAIAVRRDFPVRFWISRGVTLGELGAFADAEASFREAARLDPEHARVQVDIGSLCIVQERFDAAEEPLARALELDPHNPYAATMRLYSRLRRCIWEGLDANVAQLRALIANDTPRAAYNAVPFPLLALPLGPDVELAAARRWARQIAASVAGQPLPESAAARTPGTRLRVGFVSSDFRDHPVAYLLTECWERIDRTRIETFAYSLVPEDKSTFGQRVTRAFEHFADLTAQPAQTIARRIRGDGIDVLFDLNGYTTHSKSEIFVLKPAPVQISWLGYLGTLGAEWYDYVLTDRFACPPGLQPYFTERFLYLPDCYCPGDTRRPVAQAESRAACGLPAAGLVFCCFNNSYKILPAIFDVWMRLLAAVPESTLWLALGNVTASVNLRREAAARGIDPRRLVFAPRVSLPEHLARHVHADLFLDTAPYNAGTTANDALFMGVPVLTCAGETMASRVAGSQLHAIGLPELATTGLAQYEALALELARNPARLRDCRERLHANRHTRPLFDMARFARKLDDLLHAAWENRRVPHRS